MQFDNLQVQSNAKNQHLGRRERITSGPVAAMYSARSAMSCNAVPADAAARPASHGLSPHAFSSSCIRLCKEGARSRACWSSFSPTVSHTQRGVDLTCAAHRGVNIQLPSSAHNLPSGQQEGHSGWRSVADAGEVVRAGIVISPYDICRYADRCCSEYCSRRSTLCTSAGPRRWAARGCRRGRRRRRRPTCAAATPPGTRSGTAPPPPAEPPAAPETPPATRPSPDDVAANSWVGDFANRESTLSATGCPAVLLTILTVASIWVTSAARRAFNLTSYVESIAYCL